MKNRKESYGKSVRRNPKIIIPEAIPYERYRDEIIELMMHNRHLKVIFIVAPSGYGKTIVLAQLARKNLSQSIWLKITEEDRDPLSFLNSMASAIKLKGVETPTFDKAILSKMNRERIASSLYSDLNDHEEDLIIFVDGAEILSDESGKILQRIIIEIGEGHQFIISQHTKSSLNITPFLTNGNGLLIDHRRLAFNKLDIEEISKRIITNKQENLLEIHKNYDWPAYLMLSLYNHTHDNSLSVDELIDNLINKLPKDVKENIDYLSIFDVWNEKDILELNIPLPEDWVSDILKSGLPIISNSEGYVPHDALRDLLFDRFDKKRSRNTRYSLYNRIAKKFEREGSIYSAIKYYSMSQNFESAISLANQLSQRWYIAADWHIAQEALVLIPTDNLTEDLKAILALALVETRKNEEAQKIIN